MKLISTFNTKTGAKNHTMPCQQGKKLFKTWKVYKPYDNLACKHENGAQGCKWWTGVATALFRKTSLSCLCSFGPKLGQVQRQVASRLCILPIGRISGTSLVSSIAPRTPAYVPSQWHTPIVSNIKPQRQRRRTMKCLAMKLPSHHNTTADYWIRANIIAASGSKYESLSPEDWRINTSTTTEEMAAYEQRSCCNGHERGIDPGRLGMILVICRSLRHLGVVLLHSQPLPPLHVREVSTEYLEGGGGALSPSLAESQTFGWLRQMTPAEIWNHRPKK